MRSRAFHFAWMAVAPLVHFTDLMRLRHWTPTSATAAPSFETLRQVIAVVDRPSTRARSTRQIFLSSRLRCHKGGRVHGGDECLDCGRLVSVTPSAGHDEVHVRCLWTESDLVDDVMTPAPVLVHVPSSTTIGAADAVAAREGIHHLLIGDASWIEGAICRCLLAEPGSRAGNGTPVADRMVHDLTTVPPGTSLGQALRALESTPLGLIAVTRNGDLLGVVTRRDLGLGDAGHAP
jgi:CBS domain-containing protein